jgi:hypothetical protein
MNNRRGFDLIDESILSKEQMALIRQIAREEMTTVTDKVAVIAEAVAAEIIGKRLEGVPTVSEMTLLFERQQQSIHEFISSTDLYLRRAEREFTGIGDIKRDIGTLTASMNIRNSQLDEMQRDLSSIGERVGRQAETQIELHGKYDELKTSIFGDPALPEIPSLTAQLNERSRRADQQHDEIKTLLSAEIKPMIERVNARMVDVEVFIAKRRQIEDVVKNAVLFVAKNPKWIAIIAGGGTGLAFLIEWIKAATQ